MIYITDKIILLEDDIEIKFIRSPGPGGQHVNKVESAVQIKFNVRKCEGIDDDMYDRLTKIAGQKMTSNGVIIFTANTTKSQLRNKEIAIARLIDVLRKASIKPKIRKNTRPSLAALKRRVDNKKKRAETKKLRKKRISE